MKTFDFLKRYESFKESPQYQFYALVRENRFYISILRDNYRDVYKVVKFHNSPDNDKILWMNLEPKIRRKTQVKVIKTLLNYLSSIFSVVDYSRRKLRPLLEKNININEAFQQRIKSDFHLNPLHRFVQGLRNYISHYSYLKITSQINFSNHINNSSRNIYIPKSIFLEWKNWDKSSLSLLETLEDKVYLIDLINEHYKFFIQFQDWTFLNLLLVDYDFSKRIYDEMKSLLDEATSLGLNCNLPFDKVYLRYYKYVLNKSLALGLTSEEVKVL